jgi:hypothetical protein
MRRVSSFFWTIPWLAVLAACGADNPQTAQSAVGRNFDQLASAVAECADSLGSCNHDAKDKAARDTCNDEFDDCRAEAGKEAEEALADAISQCQERAQACRADASTGSDEERCSASLRTCIGEANSKAHHASKDDAGAAGSNAPTYQCFGQLRECIDGDKAPKECAAQARACVIAAVSAPDSRPVNPKPSMDAGTSDAGRGGSGAGGSSGASGAAGKAGAQAAAGGGGKAGSHSSAGASGAAGSNATAGAGGAMSDLARECAAEHEACVMSGEKAMTCAKEQRKCLKQDSGDQDEP